MAPTSFTCTLLHLGRPCQCDQLLHTSVQRGGRARLSAAHGPEQVLGGGQSRALGPGRPRAVAVSGHRGQHAEDSRGRVGNVARQVAPPRLLLLRDQLARDLGLELRACATAHVKGGATLNKSELYHSAESTRDLNTVKHR